MNALILALGIAALLTAVVWAVVSLIEQADAEQGPAPTLRPLDPLFDSPYLDGLGEHQAAWDAHVEDALRVTLGEPIYARLVCEEIEKAEGWL